MTTPTPIRELCAKATPGPWHWSHGALMHDTLLLPQEFIIWPRNIIAPEEVLCKENHIDWWRQVTGACGPVSEQAAPYNAELIARLDPQTVLMCVEALETAANVGQIRFPVCALDRDAHDRITAALRALNGQRDGGAK